MLLESALTPRWTPLREHDVQKALMNSRARFRMVPAGRRSGKTECAKRHTVICAMEGTAFEDPRFAFCAPTRDQAKRLYWDDLKALIPPWLIHRKSESQLYIELLNGSQIWVIGMDKPQRIEGSPWDGIVMDEFANMKKGAWAENVLPALMDRKGWAWLIGVPEGRNHYWELYDWIRTEKAKGKASDWEIFEWSSRTVVDPEEIARMEAMMDDDTIAQEIDATFLSFKGRVYKSFKYADHVRPLVWDPERPLVFAFDFNVDPGVCAVMQEQLLPNGVFGTGIIGEVYIKDDSNTEKVCARLIEDWRDQEGPVFLFGDRTGGNRGSAKTKGSDWDIVRRDLRNVFDLQFRVPKPPNPSPRARVNTLNSRLRTADGLIQMMIDPRCTRIIKDLEGVIWLEGSAGEINKKDRELTHLSDAIGYYTFERWPVMISPPKKRARVVTG
jgi:hypothetical protein